MGSRAFPTIVLCYLHYATASFMIDAEFNDAALNFPSINDTNSSECHINNVSTNHAIPTASGIGTSKTAPVASTSSVGTTVTGWDADLPTDDDIDPEYDAAEGEEYPSVTDNLPALDTSNDSDSNSSNSLDYIPWDELHIVKILTKTPMGIRKSAGALVQDRIVVTCCQCVKTSDPNDLFTYTGRGEGQENAIEVTLGVTGETRYVDRISFGIRRYCIDDPNTHIGVTLILTKPFNADPMQLTLGPTRGVCRFYAFKKKTHSGPEPSILGHHDLHVLPFKSSSRVCRSEWNITNRLIVCGSVFDEQEQFCHLRLGAVVICDFQLMGVSQTTCGVPYYETDQTKKRVHAYVSIMTKEELRYWQKLIDLIGGETDSSGDNNHNVFFVSSLFVTEGIVLYSHIKLLNLFNNYSVRSQRFNFTFP